MNKYVKKLAIQMALIAANGFLFTAGSLAMKKISDKTGFLASTEKKDD